MMRGNLNASKLTIEQRRQLSEELHQRRELLQALAKLSLKRLAARYGVHHQSVWRLDVAIHGYHLPDPVVRNAVKC